ncbi:MAG: hypothetical protein M3680_27685 [Myxococcota bacterium]|nr:hypothetical protein [Myxococcota bacterium]
MGHDQAPAPTSQLTSAAAVAAAVAPAPAQDHAPGATPLAALAQDSEAAWTAVEDFAKTGKGSAAGMPLLLRSIPRTKREDAYLLMPELAARMGGERFLECAAAFGYAPYFAISVALDTAKPPATPAALGAYLRGRSVDELAALDASPPVIKQLQALLPGPLGLVIPQLAELPRRSTTSERCSTGSSSPPAAPPCSHSPSPRPARRRSPRRSISIPCCGASSITSTSAAARSSVARSDSSRRRRRTPSPSASSTRS